MERNYTNENFERFLRQNADGLRMRPSDKVWKGINRDLNKRRRRIGFFLAFALLISTAAGYYFIEQGFGTASHTARQQVPASVTPSHTETPAIKLPKKSATSLKRFYPGQGSIDMIDAFAAPTPSGTSSTSDVAHNSTETLNPGFDLAYNVMSDQISETSQNEFTGTIVDDYPGTEQEEMQTPVAKEQAPVLFPLTIESVTNIYKPRIRKSKWDLQLFFTPTVSYRRLTENKNYTVTKSSNYGNLYSINNAVTHKPDFGFQVGLIGKYPLSDNFKLRGGVQFNVARYDIKTYNSSYEVAKIQFMNRDSMAVVTGYSNFAGYKSSWLENLYFQVALPVGLEMKVSGNEKTHLGIAATIQPSYLIGDRAYVISTDYKAYIEAPSLVRKWNVNTSFETFVNYSTGKTQWQVGPQVRYQLLSSFDKKYPVKEHLFDFGLKVGVTLNNR